MAGISVRELKKVYTENAEFKLKKKPVLVVMKGVKTNDPAVFAFVRTREKPGRYRFEAA